MKPTSGWDSSRRREPRRRSSTRSSAKSSRCWRRPRSRATWRPQESRSWDRRPPSSTRSFARKRSSGRKSFARRARRSTEASLPRLHSRRNRGPSAMNDRQAATNVPVTGVEHWTTKATAEGDVRLFLWEKFTGSPEGKPAVLFVHGSSMASQPTFDLTVPGRPDSSVMDWFARRGFVCWCVDMEGYGRSDKHRDIYCDISNGADDLAAATDYIAARRGVRSFLAYGISSGALRAALFAERHPDRVSRLVLDAFVW